VRGLDPTKTRDHRRQQAERGFPLLRGSPNTAAIGLVAFLDRLSAGKQLSFADQLSDLVDGQLANPAMTGEKRLALVRSLPLVEQHFGRHFGLTSAHIPSIDVRVIPVKVLAGVLKDKTVGGFDGWAKLVTFSEEPDARAPAAAHASSLQEIVPIAPGRLRKLIGDAMKKQLGAGEQRVNAEHIQFTAQLPGGNVKVDVIFAKGGTARHQFGYHVSAKIGASPLISMASYEGVWLTNSHWDYVTEANADRSVAHLIRQIETCLELT
jgi:hypothetical protein